MDQEKAKEDFLCLYEDLYMEFSKFGKIDSLHVCDNLGESYLFRIHCVFDSSSQQSVLSLGDHMIGHVYCKFFNEEDASDAIQVMNGRYYDGRKMEVEFSPVQNFHEVRLCLFAMQRNFRGGKHLTLIVLCCRHAVVTLMRKIVPEGDSATLCT